MAHPIDKESSVTKRQHLENVRELTKGLVVPKELTNQPIIPPDLQDYLVMYYQIIQYKQHLDELFTLQDIINYQTIFEVKFHSLDVQIMKRLDFVYISTINKLRQEQ